ncbi:MAG: hypothetical protein HY703_02820 [Gemmatimonadetes bacterium]|nr:hypothetical protein [Gemmatimonadota bacterium]
MKYLVTMDFVDPGPLLPLQGFADMLDQLVIPGLEACARLEAEGKIAGGLLAGARALAFLAEAGSNEELDALLHGLPFWGVLRTTTTPLQSFANRASQDRRARDQLRAMAR